MGRTSWEKWRPPLTCIAYHHIGHDTSGILQRLRATTPTDLFVRQLDYIQRHYNVVELDQIREGDLPKRAALITFDDSYRSVLEVAAPLLASRKIPAIFFANAGPIIDGVVPLDILISFATRELGAEKVARLGSVGKSKNNIFSNGPDFINPMMAPSQIVDFKTRLLSLLQVTEQQLNRTLDLFLRPHELKQIAKYRLEIGNHTLSHVFCRSLGHRELEIEIVRNKEILESIAIMPNGRRVRSFAFPWGRASDATPAAMQVIRSSGHEMTFLMHGRNNWRRPESDIWYRVLASDQSRMAFWRDLQIMPVLREMRALFGATH